MKNITSLENLDNFIELISDLAFFKDTNGVHTHCNEAFLRFIQKDRESVIAKTDFDIYSNENAAQFSEDDKKILEEDRSKSFEEVFKKNNEYVYFYTSKQIIYDENKNQLGLFCIAKEITKQKEYEFIYEDNKYILEYIARHDNLTDILDKLVNLAQRRNTDSKCSVLLLNDTKTNLFSGSAPSLPDFYNDAVNGIEIGEKVGSCGSAVFKKERVIIENIDTHENWQPYLGLTTKANLHACWSEPIFSSTDEILGSFAIYNETPKKPSEFELKLISSYAHLASVAIEKENNIRIIKEKEKQIFEQTKISNEKLKYSKNELSKIFHNALVGLMYISETRVLLNCNQHLANILGYVSPKEMIGLSMRDLHLSQERFIDFGLKNFDTLKDKENFNIEYQLQKKDASALWCELSGTALDDNIPADLSKGVLWSITDIAKRKKLEESVKDRTKEIEKKNEQLKDLAAKDYLTGLYNRSKLDEALEFQIKHAKRYATTFGIIILDIDYFKVVNDKYGHQIGDSVLCEFSDLLLESSRETDMVGRWGGEEFLIIVENVNKENILKLAEKLRELVESHNFAVVKQKTASFGVTIYHENDKINELVTRADEALYEAKNSGRNLVKFYE